MKLYFKILIGTVPRGVLTIKEVSTAEISIKKEQRARVSPSEKLNISKAPQKGGINKF